MGMRINIIISNMAPVSLGATFHWPPSKHSILDCGTVQIFVRLERLQEAAHKLDLLSLQEGHFLRWPSEGRLGVQIFGRLGRSRVNGKA